MLPPPMSRPKPSSIVVEFAIASQPQRASSSPLITRARRPVLRSISASSSSPLAASRIALVARASICRTPVARQKAENTAAVWSASSTRSGRRTRSPFAEAVPIPAPIRTASRISSTRLHHGVPGS